MVYGIIFGFITFYKPIVGLCFYILFDAYVDLIVIKLLPIPDIFSIVAAINRYIIFSLVVAGFFSFSGFKENYIVKTKTFFYIVMAFIIFSFASYFWADFPNRYLVVDELSRLYKMIFIIPALFFTINTEKELNTIIFIYLITFLIKNLFSVSEFILINKPVIIDGGLSLLAFSLIIFFNSRNKLYQLLASISIFLPISTYLIMGTRRSMVAVFLIILITLYFHFKKKSAHKIIYIAPVIILPALLFNEELIYRYYQTIRIFEFGGSLDDSAWSGRNYIWEAGLRMFLDSPVFGQGFGISDSILKEYAGPIVDTRKRLHNSYLKALAELGIIGFSLFCLIMFNVIQKLFRQYRILFKIRLINSSNLVFSIFAEVLGFSFIAIFGWSAYLDKQFWFMIGIVFAVSKVISLEIKKLELVKHVR